MEIPKVTHNGISFINFNKPAKEQLAFLNKHYGFAILSLEDYLYKTQVPKIETHAEYVLIVIDVQYIPGSIKTKEISIKSLVSPFIFPGTNMTHFSPKAPRKKRISIGEVDFYIGKDYLVILHDEKTPQIDEIFTMCQDSEEYRRDLMEKGPVYLFYRLTDILVDSSFLYIDEITNEIDYIDKKMDEKSTASIIEDISMTRRNIVVFETMIKPLLPIFSDLEKGKYPQLNGDMTQYWSNILDHLQKVWDRLEDNKELIEGLARSYESLLTIRTNEIIRVLTVFTVILLPLTLLASVYGMNISLPFENSPDAFSLIVGGMGILAALMIGIFRWRNWL